MRLCAVAGYRELVSLTEEERKELTGWAQSRTLPAGDVFRARLILALADGMTYETIKSRLQTTAPTISGWKRLFEEIRDGGVGAATQGQQAADSNTSGGSQDLPEGRIETARRR